MGPKIVCHNTMNKRLPQFGKKQAFLSSTKGFNTVSNPKILMSLLYTSAAKYILDSNDS